MWILIFIKVVIVGQFGVGCYLKVLFDFIGELSNLVILKVFNNILRFLLEIIGCLINLRYLDI